MEGKEASCWKVEVLGGGCELCELYEAGSAVGGALGCYYVLCRQTSAAMRRLPPVALEAAAAAKKKKNNLRKGRFAAGTDQPDRLSAFFSFIYLYTHKQRLLIFS